MLKIEFFEDAYQYALKTKDKLKRKGQVDSKGNQKLDNLTQAKLSVAKDEPKHVEQKRRTRRGEFGGKFYKCGEGHRSFECSQKACDRKIVVVDKFENLVVELKQGENLMTW